MGTVIAIQVRDGSDARMPRTSSIFGSDPGRACLLSGSPGPYESRVLRYSESTRGDYDKVAVDLQSGKELTVVGRIRWADVDAGLRLNGKPGSNSDRSPKARV